MSVDKKQSKIFNTVKKKDCVKPVIWLCTVPTGNCYLQCKFGLDCSCLNEHYIPKFCLSLFIHKPHVIHVAVTFHLFVFLFDKCDLWYTRLVWKRERSKTENWLSAGMGRRFVVSGKTFIMTNMCYLKICP